MRWIKARSGLVTDDDAGVRCLLRRLRNAGAGCGEDDWLGGGVVGVEQLTDWVGLALENGGLDGLQGRWILHLDLTCESELMAGYWMVVMMVMVIVIILLLSLCDIINIVLFLF